MKVSTLLTLETAHTPEEHMAIFKRYGVVWWWKLKKGEDDLWNKIVLREKVSENSARFKDGEYFYVTHPFSHWFR